MSSGSIKTFANRYSLDVQTASVGGASEWRAQDTNLRRWVSLLLLQESDPRASALNRNASLAARNDRRDVVAILDVIPGEFVRSDNAPDIGPFVGIVSEFVVGQSLDGLIRENGPYESDDALALFEKIVQSVQEAADLGITHGRLRPHSVLIQDSTTVRVSGFGIDSTLYGTDENSSDLKGLGNLLFAISTGLWPTVPVDGLPGSPGGVNSKPSDVRSGISAVVDSIYQQLNSGQITSFADLLTAIRVEKSEYASQSHSRMQNITAKLSTPTVVWQKSTTVESHRLRSVAIAGLTVCLLGWSGWQLLTRNFNSTDEPVALFPSSSASVQVTESAPPVLTPAEIIAISDYDPFGDQTENPKMAQLAIDGDPATSWNTVQYLHNDLAGKPGVGLLLDLGSQSPVSEVDLSFVGPGHSATVFVTDSPTPDVQTAEQLGSITDGEADVVIKAPRPINGRYVLVWLTYVPLGKNSNYQGGITNISVKL